MEDRYMYYDDCFNRLMLDIKTHGKLIIAFDFDNTIFDFHNSGDTYPMVVKLLQEAKEKGHTLLLFTANENLKLCIQFCEDNFIKPDYVNDSPVNPGGRKPYYNILLDDRAGLGMCYSLLKDVLCKAAGDEI